jgi:hypothetical protein
MQVIDAGLVVKPNISLIAVTTPKVIGALLPTVQDGLVLALIVSTS